MASQKSQTLTEAIKEDHEEMYEYYDLYQKAAGNADAQERWARQLIWEVARHAVGEEIVVYPLMEQYLGETGLKQANHDREEHQELKVMLSELESLTPATESYSGLLKKVMDHLRHHNDDEEVKDLPILEPAMGEEKSRAAAKEFTRTKMFVPTRAHPSLPNQPPAETLAGFLVTPIDKLKDAFAKFPTEEMKESA